MTLEKALYAGVMYCSDDGKVLLVKRSPDAKSSPGLWAFPAGHVENSETPIDGARREFTEETGNTPADLKPLAAYGDFALFRATGSQFTPALNEEHTEFVWADPQNLPAPLHRAVADQVSSHAMDEGARREDQNGYITIERNPITKAGVFPYSGKQLPGADPNKIYNVYRPAEELSDPETLKSLRGLPIYDEHAMTGRGYQTAPEDKGIHGATGEEIIFDGVNVLAPLRIFSDTMKRLMAAGKRGLSLGYRCVFEKSAGAFEGMPYDYIQKNIRGNHLALVAEGRCGTAVLDHHWAFDHFDLALSEREKNMADEDKGKKAEGESEKKEMGLAEITAALETLAPFMAKINEFMEAHGKKDADTGTGNALDEDEKKKDGDQKAEDEDKKDDDKKDDKKGDAMDAAISTLTARLDAVEKRGVKELLSDVTARDKLVKEITPVIGTFDHAEMTSGEAAAYACEKLGLKPAKGGERAALDGYLAGFRANRGTIAGTSFAMDTKQPKAGGLLSKTLNEANA